MRMGPPGLACTERNLGSAAPVPPGSAYGAPVDPTTFVVAPCRATGMGVRCHRLGRRTRSVGGSSTRRTLRRVRGRTVSPDAAQSLVLVTVAGTRGPDDPCGFVVCGSAALIGADDQQRSPISGKTAVVLDDGGQHLGLQL